VFEEIVRIPFESTREAISEVSTYAGSPSEMAMQPKRVNWWTDIKSIGFDELDRREVPPGFERGVTVPVIHMPTYMGYLRTRFLEQCDGTIERRRVDQIQHELGNCHLLVNCTGLGARDLGDVDDRAMHPCQGQVVAVEPHPAVRELIFITTGPNYVHEPLYIVPRDGHDVILGGTTVDDVYDTTPDPKVTRRIVDRCATLVPAVASTRIIQSKVGLRPARRGDVQVCRDATGKFDKPVIHNYGHSGAGVTLSWGCAAEVLRLAAPLQPANS
jgi:D-amino-acid oxidase